MHAKSLQLRPEQKRLARPSVIKRLLAKTIAREGQRLSFPVPSGESEHAVESWKRLDHSPTVEGREQHFGIRMASKAQRMIVRQQLAAQFFEVVDFAIEHQRVPAA